MGGLVAMEMSIARPQQIWALALLATTAEPVTVEERSRRLALADAVERQGMAPLVEVMEPHLFGPGADAEVVARVHAMMANNNPMGAAAALRGRAERPDYRERLQGLTIPSLVCVGTRDHWSTARVTEQLVACLHAPRTLTLPDVGHLPNLEKHADVNAALLDFLAAATETGR
jgi:pimeloyl-ACP methyl ester carboxylesterase